MALSEKGRTLLYLFLLWLIYLIVGVFIFRAVEHDGDKEPDKSEEAQLAKVKGNIMAKYNISESEFNDIVQQIQTASSSNAGPEWNYHEAVSFVIQLVTTIGKVVHLIYLDILPSNPKHELVIRTSGLPTINDTSSRKSVLTPKYENVYKAIKHYWLH